MKTFSVLNDEKYFVVGGSWDSSKARSRAAWGAAKVIRQLLFVLSNPLWLTVKIRILKWV